jgi:hypothetical protein
MADVLSIKTEEQISNPNDCPQWIEMSVYEAKKWFERLLSQSQPGH